MNKKELKKKMIAKDFNGYDLMMEEQRVL